jgi:hypothetical protein
MKYTRAAGAVSGPRQAGNIYNKVDFMNMLTSTLGMGNEISRAAGNILAVAVFLFAAGHLTPTSVQQTLSGQSRNRTGKTKYLI